MEPHPIQLLLDAGLVPANLADVLQVPQRKERTAKHQFISTAKVITAEEYVEEMHQRDEEVRLKEKEKKGKKEGEERRNKRKKRKNGSKLRRNGSKLRRRNTKG